MELSTLMNYAKAKNARIEIIGNNHSIEYFTTKNGDKVSLDYGFNRGGVYVVDASSRYRAHTVVYRFSSTGKLFFEKRVNFASGAEQKTLIKEMAFKTHVAETLNLDYSEL